MKKLIIFLCLLCLTSAWAGYHGIVNNSGSTPADSLSIPFYALDSAGNMVATATNDSVFLTVFYPSGAEAFRDSLAYNGTKITTVTYAGYTRYSWKEAIADIDGTPVEGTYSYVLTVIDNTSADLATPHTGTFQLYATADFDVYLDDIADDSTLLNEDSNIGIDLDDVTGTLDPADFNATFFAVIWDSLALNNASTFDGNLNLDNATGSLAASQFEAAFFAIIYDTLAINNVSTFDGNLNLDNATGNLGASQFEAGYYAVIWDTLALNGISILNEDSNIGLDLDDITGTLDDGEVATIGINIVSADADVFLPTHFHQDYYTAWRDSIEEFTWEADTAEHNGVSASFGQVLSTPSYVQGAGADATPSEWDATDSTVFMSLVWLVPDTSDYNDNASTYGNILATPAYVQGSGGDPWSTALPGAYGAGTAGKIVGDNINATISSRSTFDGNLNLDNATGSLAASQFEATFFAIVWDTLALNSISTFDGNLNLNNATGDLSKDQFEATYYATIQDTMGLSATDYKATGFSTHSANDVRDAIKNDCSETGTGLDSIMYAYFIYSTRENLFKATGFSTHDAPAVYTEFTSGSNEDAFKSDGDTNQVTFPTNFVSLNIRADGGVMVQDTLADGDSLMTQTDTTACQGEAGSLTAPAVASEVADTLLIGRGLSSSGAGEYACSLYVLDSSDSSTVSDCWCNVRPKAGGNLLGRTTNSANAYMIFMLDAADSLQYAVYRAGYTVTVPEYITITTNQSDTIFLTEITSTAPDVGKTNVTFQVQTPAGDTLPTTIFEWQLVDSTGKYFAQNVHLTVGSGTNTVRLSPETHADTSTSSLFESMLYPCASITASGGQTVYYRMKVKFSDGSIAKIDTITISGDSQNPFD